MTSTARDQLIATSNLRQVWLDNWQRVKNSTPGVDGITPLQFHNDLNARVRFIRSEVRDGYSYSLLRGVKAPKKDPSKFRIICVPTIQDRLVQRALLQVLETKAASLGVTNDVSYGFIKDATTKKRGTSGARAAAVKHRQTKQWAFKTDITAFFDRINRTDLIKEFHRSFRLSSLSSLIEGAIRCEVDDKDPRIKRVLHDNGITPGVGLRQGMPLSPILSNFVLRDFDLAFTKAGLDMVRYADDLVVFASSFDECREIESFTRAKLSDLGHSVSEKKTEIRSPDQPIEFLGMELGLKPGTQKYMLTVSEAQMGAIRDSFTVFHDLDFSVREGLNLPKLLNRLINMKSGYGAAYGIADNFDTLSKCLDLWTSNCVRAVYGSIFGRESISKLNARQRQFLLLPPD